MRLTFEKKLFHGTSSLLLAFHSKNLIESIAIP